MAHAAPTSTAATTRCHRFAFVHIPKTGGSTIVSVVQGPKDSPTKNRLLSSRRLKFDGMDKLGHDSAARQRAILTPRVWDSAYTFSIVRDPYDWTISQFFYHLEEHCPNKDSTKNFNKSVGRVGQQAGACQDAAALSAIDDVTDPMYRAAFGSWIARLDNRSSLKGIGAIGQVLKDEGDDGRPERKATAVTQKAWLTDRDGRLIVKHIFKIGSAEYAKAATCEGLQSLLCDRVDPRLRCANHTREPSVVKSTRHGTRRDYYTAASCAAVARWFREDFEAFGFDAAACP